MERHWLSRLFFAVVLLLGGPSHAQETALAAAGAAVASASRSARRSQPTRRLHDQRKLQSQLTSQPWTQPRWWSHYRYMLTRKILKKCVSYGGVAPENGSTCTKKNRPRAFGYSCMFGTQFCASSLYGMVHPETRCDCVSLEDDPDEGRWNCYDWVEACIGDTLFRSPADSPITATLPLYTPDVVSGYANLRDLREGIENAGNFLASTIIKTDIGADPVYLERSWGRGDDWVRPAPIFNAVLNDVDFGFDVEFDQALAASVGSESSGIAEPLSGPSAEGVDDFETNNQEEGVDEADRVKSNGKYTFAAYGDILVIWEADTGVSVLNVTLPPISEVTSSPSSTPASTEEDAAGGDQSLTSIAIPYYFPKPRPNILSMLLNGDRLVLVVRGYGFSLRSELGYADPLLRDLLNTNVRIYDISKLGEGLLPLVHDVHINGDYQDARAIGNNVHVVTSSYLNTWTHLSRPLRRAEPDYIGLSDDEYRERAVMMAKEVVIPTFIERLIEELSIVTGEVPDLAKISLLQSDLEGSESIEDLIFGDGIINYYTSIASFDMATPVDEILLPQESGAFAPLTGTYTYANEDMIILAMSGWDWNRDLFATGEYIFLMGFGLDGPTSTPAALGTLPGRILNQNSIDFFDGHVRIATSLRARWGNFLTGPSSEPEDLRRTLNYIIVMEIAAKTDQGNAGSFTEVGRTTNLGRDGEVFTAVRFFDMVAYAVTFERTDPFYVIDMKDPTMPTVLGELNITGFSSYLHSINDDDTLILAVGQEADETGRALGVQITLFDATDPSMPTALQRFTVEEDDNIFSSTTAEFDFKSFRYVSLGDDFGILIMPLSISQPCCEQEGNFDGFVVYNISPDLIEERLRISHVNSQDYFGCYYRAFLPQRSFVIDGNVTTLKGHSVVSMDLNFGTPTWKLEMPKPEEENECGYWIPEPFPIGPFPINPLPIDIDLPIDIEFGPSP